MITESKIKPEVAGSAPAQCTCRRERSALFCVFYLTYCCHSPSVITVLENFDPVKLFALMIDIMILGWCAEKIASS